MATSASHWMTGNKDNNIATIKNKTIIQLREDYGTNKSKIANGKITTIIGVV